ncbi:TetR/AcrR family transcriptional regulator [Hymenobacter tibetensis]|uniref:TetR/AcrR family transcriptional regulator n=1 Tax=Hymenobacter tibetensis TaxID=497967 RepID=A0ABY4CTH8_9BACT|nr:TetR/AcrR family transcriptional regulator [Hymenobacter tibetensis]UOG73352.1 TetR/AcrR family transcriptional regulator [Hymenobacter tibetensis]
MGVAERKLREKKQREEAILAAAKQVFQQKGLVAATMDDIAAVAELAKGTLYRHYRSKEDIMLLINERALQEMHGQFVQVTAAAATGLEKILRLTQAYYAFCLAHPAYFDFIAFFESPFPSTNVATLYATNTAIRELVMHLLEQGMQDGSIRTDLKAELLTNIMWASSYGIMQLIVSRGGHLTENQEINLDELFATYLTTLTAGLRP